MGLGTSTVVQGQDFRDISSIQTMPLGAYAETPNGRGYRYGQAGAVALDPGKMTTNPAVDANVVDVNVATSAVVGATEVVIDAGGAVTADAYADGTIAISDAAGEGIEYRVKGNTVTSGAAEMTVYLEDPLEVAVTVDASQVTLLKSPWDGLIIVPATDQADFPAGIPNVSVTAAYYAWVQTKGVCAAWADETFARGAPLTFGTGVAGQLEAVDAAGEVQVGVAIEAASAIAEYPQVFLMID